MMTRKGAAAVGASPVRFENAASILIAAMGGKLAFFNRNVDSSD